MNSHNQNDIFISLPYILHISKEQKILIQKDCDFLSVLERMKKQTQINGELQMKGRDYTFSHGGPLLNISHQGMRRSFINLDIFNMYRSIFSYVNDVTGKIWVDEALVELRYADNICSLTSYKSTLEQLATPFMDSDEFNARDWRSTLPCTPATFSAMVKR